MKKSYLMVAVCLLAISTTHVSAAPVTIKVTGTLTESYSFGDPDNLNGSRISITYSADTTDTATSGGTGSGASFSFFDVFSMDVSITNRPNAAADIFETIAAGNDPSARNLYAPSVDNDTFTFDSRGMTIDGSFYNVGLIAFDFGSQAFFPGTSAPADLSFLESLAGDMTSIFNPAFNTNWLQEFPLGDAYDLSNVCVNNSLPVAADPIVYNLLAYAPPGGVLGNNIVTGSITTDGTTGCGLDPTSIIIDYSVTLSDGTTTTFINFADEVKERGATVSATSEHLTLDAGTSGPGLFQETYWCLGPCGIPNSVVYEDRFSAPTEMNVLVYANGPGPSQGLVGSRIIASTVPTPGFESDGDGILDSTDNCTDVANAEQIDSDSDGFGNACDGDFVDFGGPCLTNIFDLFVFKAAFGNTEADPQFDMTNTGGPVQVNIFDLFKFKAEFGSAPGPSACGACPCP